MSNEKVFLPGLNGIRAIAALSVVISHINNRLDYFQLPKGTLLDLASYGVTIFFTLSGFLITYLLLLELSKTGTIDVKKFYMRRVLRIWPLYYVYLLIIILMTGISSIGWPILFYLLMIPNFKNSFAAFVPSFAKPVTSMLVGHYWSLGVEEQFYAIWPWIVKKTKILFKVLVLFPIFYILLKLGLRLVHAPYSILVFVNYTRFGCLVLGGLGAYLYFHRSEKMEFVKKSWVEIAAWIFFIVVGLNRFHITSIIDHEIISIFTLIIIINQIGNPKRVLSLENNFLDYIGKISFGIYVYNPLVIYLMSFVFLWFPIENSWIKTSLVYIFVLPAVVVVAHLSYFYFEKRFLKLKTKYVTVESAASKKEL